MRKILNLVAVLAILTACSTSTPKVVEKSFADKFPDVSVTEWEQDDDGEWEAEFTMDQYEYTASFSVDGKWIETEREIGMEEIPDTVNKVVEMNYPGFEIKEGEWVESAEFTGFELLLQKPGEEGTKTEILIMKDGSVMKDTGDEEDTQDTEDD